jgi:hypothetical protein
MTAMRMKTAGKSVWYDNTMLDKSTAAMEEGVRASECFIIFLTGHEVSETVAVCQSKTADATDFEAFKAQVSAAIVDVQMEQAHQQHLGRVHQRQLEESGIDPGDDPAGDTADTSALKARLDANWSDVRASLHTEQVQLLYNRIQIDELPGTREPAPEGAASDSGSDSGSDSSGGVANLTFAILPAAFGRTNSGLPQPSAEAIAHSMATSSSLGRTAEVVTLKQPPKARAPSSASVAASDFAASDSTEPLSKRLSALRNG